jgi:uncharacterized iron-regulated membrane protein
MTRRIWELAHRWVGLAIAGFLFVSGLTGAVIAWEHELDALLNPTMTRTDSAGPFRSPFELAAMIEARDPRAEVSYITLMSEPGEALLFGVDPRMDPATGTLFDLGYSEVFVDPVTGEETGRRAWGAVWPISTENLMSFLYVLHYTLHIPAFWGIDHWGTWLMGGIALLWLVDCFVGFYLTLPMKHPLRSRLSRWGPAWKIKKTGSFYRINFDIHRAFGLWTWLVLFVLAFSSVALNLHDEVFYPAVSLFSETTPNAYESRTPTETIAPHFDFAQILARATTDAAARGWSEPPGYIYYGRGYGMYEVSFFQPGEIRGVAGAGAKQLFYDGSDGSLIGEWQPWRGSAADALIEVQFPLHSGRIIGLPGRILVSAMGLVVAALSVTGVVIWWRKRNARRLRARLSRSS